MGDGSQVRGRVLRPGQPGNHQPRGRTTFDWLAGRFFLTQRFVNEHPAAPSGIAIIGPGEELGTAEILTV